MPINGWIGISHERGYSVTVNKSGTVSMGDITTPAIYFSLNATAGEMPYIRLSSGADEPE
jgi:hypothetical protein